MPQLPVPRRSPRRKASLIKTLLLLAFLPRAKSEMQAEFTRIVNGCHSGEWPRLAATH